MRKVNYIILSAYSILTILFTYPVAFSTGRIAGLGDVFQFLWTFWWFKESLLNFSNPYYTNYIFYPSGVSLAFSTITPLNSIASIPLQLAFGLVNAYNIIWILTFILSGYGTFLLVKYLTGDTRSAFVAGLIFMFCPYRFAHALGHMNLLSTQWIPFYILFLIKTIDEKNVYNSLFASIFLLLTAISCYYYLIYLCVFTLLYLGFRQWSDKTILNQQVLKRIATMGISFGIIAFPFMFPLIKEIVISKSTYMYAGGFVEYSADLLGFFLPQVFHPLFKDVVSPIYSNFSGNAAEYTVFMGYTVILLSILGLIKIKTNEAKFWALSAAIFFVLCLGPILHVNGILSIPVEDYDLYIPLPYAVLMHIPFFSMARVPSRWDVLVMLSLAVLAGYGLSYIFDKLGAKLLKNKYKINIILILFSCLILFEFLSVPYTMSNAEIPNFYEQIANDDEDYAILEVPIIWYADVMYYQTLHEKNLVGGYVSRPPNNAIAFLKSTPLVSDLLNFYASDEDIINQNLSEIGISIANHYNIRYIILHKDRMTSEQLDFASYILQKSIDEKPLIFENESMLVYEAKKEPLNSFIVFNGGWHDLEKWNSIPTRWMSESASLLVYSNENRTADLSLHLFSFMRPRTLEIYLNERPLMMRPEISSEDFVMVSVPINLNEGINIIRFHVPEGCERPCDIPELKNDDSRWLSIAVQNISITSPNTTL